MPPNTMSPGPNPPPPSKTPLIIAGVVAGVALIGGGIALAAWQGWIPLFAQKPPTLEQVADAFQNIESARVKADVILKIEPREEGVEPISLPEVDAEDESAAMVQALVTSFIPTSLDATTTITTAWQRGDETDSETSIVGEWKTGGITANLDLAFKTVDGSVYTQVNSLPVPLLDTSELEGSWIAFPKGMGGIETIFSYQDPETQVFGKEETEETAETKVDVSIQEDIRALLRESLLTGALTIVSTDPEAEVNGRGAWHMTFSFDSDAFQSAVDTLCADAGASETTHALLTEEFCEPPSEDERKAMREASKNLTVETWIDKKTSTPLRFKIATKIAYDETVAKLADKQLRMSADLVLSDINQPFVIDAPSDTIKPKRAMQILSGQSAAETSFTDQTQMIDDLRSALAAYQTEHDSYPATLNDLMGTARFPSDESDVVVNIPVDQYTGEPFPYAVVGDDYELVYQMEIPETSASFLIELQRDQYVNGTNTATSQYESREAEAAKDSDEDGLTDAQEEELGTNRFLDDTDGDGFTDKQEVDGGYDPLVPPQS